MAMTRAVPPQIGIVTRDVAAVAAAVLVPGIVVDVVADAVVPVLAVVRHARIGDAHPGIVSAAIVTRKRIVSTNVNVARRVFQTSKRSI